MTLATVTVSAALAATDSVTSRSSPEPQAVSGVVIADLPTAAHALELDAERGRLWLLTTEFDGINVLHRFDIRKGEWYHYELPSIESDGSTTRLAVATSGAVFVGMPYLIARWDPSANAVKTLALPEAVPGRSVSAEDRDAPLAGTWVSGTTVRGESAVISPVNVPFLQIISPELSISQGPAIPEDYAGSTGIATDDDSNVYLAAGYLADSNSVDVARVGPSGTLTHTKITGASRVRGRGANLQIYIPLGQAFLDQAGVVHSSDHLRDPASLESHSGSVNTIYDAFLGRVIREDGSSIRYVQLTVQTTGVVHAGKSIDVTQRESVTDVATDADGNSWFLGGNGTTLVEIAR
jgi:hypothetical protein